MPFFESVPDVEVKNQEQEMLNNAYDPERDSEPGFFEGTPEAISKGYHTATLNLINLGATAAHKTGFINDENIKTFDEAFTDVKKQLSPDPQVTGFLGQIVHPITTMLSEAIPTTLLGGPLGGAAITAGAEGVAHTKVLESEGVDPETAAKVGAVTGIGAGLGLLLPAAIPGKIATRIASGLGINIAAGGAQRGVTGKTLRDNGYSEMADQYRVLDGTSMLVDGVLGSAFGTLHSAKSTLPSLRDAALSANNIHQLEIDSAPGIPADIATRNSHIAAMEQSTLQLLDNEPVNIATKFDEPNFIAKEINPEIKEGMDSALLENGIPELEATIEKANTRGQKTQYHGTSNPIEKLYEDTYSSTNYYGQGFYTTDAMDIAEGYSKKGSGKEPTIYKFSRSDDANLFDMEKPLTQEQLQELNLPSEFIEAYHDMKDNASEDSQFNLRQVYDEARAFMTSEMESGDTIQEVYDTARASLEKQGYTGLRHLGGLRTNKEPHNVEIYWDAHKHNIEKIEGNLISEQVPIEAAQTSKSSTLPKDGDTLLGNPFESEGKTRLKPEEDPLILSAHNIIAENPNLFIINEEGDVVNAADALAMADENIYRTEKEKGLFDVAVNCFIRNG